MGRSQKPQKLAKKPSRKAANALGYAKRQSRKSQTPSSAGISDVYEHQQEKVRRAKVKLDYARDELIGAGGDGSEDEDTSSRQRGRPRLIGEGEDDEHIGDEDDEEIDSDDAFEESDEERFAGFSFSHKKMGQSKSKSNKNKKSASGSRSVRFADVDLNEDEGDEEVQSDMHPDEGSSDGEEEEEGEPDEFIDVLDILDGRGEPDSGDDMGQVEHEEGDARRKEKGKGKFAQRGDDGDDDENMMDDEDAERSESEAEDEDEDEDEDEEHISASEAEDEDSSALQDLGRFVTSLDAGQKRKAPDGDSGENNSGNPARASKRRLLKERTEAGEENEFAAHVGGQKLQIDDLLAPLAAQSSNLLSLKKSAKVLTSQSGPSKTLAAPLPQRTAERLEREAAYEQTKEEVDKWKTTMQRIREAEHLSFPLQAQPTGKTSNLELAAKFKPTTELESAVDKLLKSAKMRDEDIVQTESLKMNHLSVEEVAARRAELAKMRDLMFRAEAKAKRVAKIKSKTYHRIKKKDRARLATKLGEDDDEDDEEVRMKREVERARERATLKHKHTGKWAKAMKGRGELDEDQRREISEMLDRGEKLRRKIRGDSGTGSEDEESEDDESGEDEGGEGAIQRIKASAFEELKSLKNTGNEDPMVEGGKKGKSIFEMKFMKDAMARNERRVDEEVDDFVKEMGVPVLDEDGEVVVADEEEQPYGTAVERVGGRVIYRPGATFDGSRPLGPPESDTSSVTLKSTDLISPLQAESPRAISPAVERTNPPSEEVNPWLVRAEDSNRPIQKKHEVAISKNSGGAEKSKNKLRKREKKREEEKEKAKEDAMVDISMSNVMTLSDSNNAAGPSKKPAVVPPQSSQNNPIDTDSDSDANNEIDEQEKLLDRKGKRKANGVKAFEQRDLVALAFAGDNVVQDFAELKRQEMQQDAPREIDTTLPGWGSWGGKGAKKAPTKPFLIKKVAGIDPTTRADYKKSHVIISEKRDKKAAKYLVKDLPYPYTSKAQYERSLDTPLGIEWNTRVGFQRATLPRVVKKPGTIISPLEKLT